MLRTGVLTGRTVALAGAPPALADALRALGATVDDAPAGDGSARPDTLVVDARAAFGAGGHDGLRAATDGAFAAARDTATAHWIARPGTGQLVLIAPTPGAGRHATAARAALENLARTLGTEWARHAVTTVALLPGDATTDDALAQLVGWLASPAGAYLSGTALTLDRPA